jgi:hypothetical protein
MSLEQLQEELGKCVKKAVAYRTSEMQAELRKMEDDLRIGPRYGGGPPANPQLAQLYQMWKLKVRLFLCCFSSFSSLCCRKRTWPST